MENTAFRLYTLKECRKALASHNTGLHARATAHTTQSKDIYGRNRLFPRGAKGRSGFFRPASRRWAGETHEKKHFRERHVRVLGRNTRTVSVNIVRYPKQNEKRNGKEKRGRGKTKRQARSSQTRRGGCPLSYPRYHFPRKEEEEALTPNEQNLSVQRLC